MIQQYKNAKKCIQQIHADEWVPKCNPFDGKYYTFEHFETKKELWLGHSTGGWFVDISNSNSSNYFGIFFRHWVYFHAKRYLKTITESKTPVL